MEKLTIKDKQQQQKDKVISDGKKSSTHKYIKISSCKKGRAQMHFQLITAYDQQLIAIFVMYRLLFENLMVTTNQKSQQIQKRKMNLNTALKSVIK